MTKEAFNELAAWLIRRVATGQLPRERAANQLYMAFQQCKGVNYLTYDSFEEAIQNV
tara:strand:- start:633 stop:803 length:171 start_codon:yes stop_codon:yes gene_type:complete